MAKNPKKTDKTPTTPLGVALSDISLAFASVKAKEVADAKAKKVKDKRPIFTDDRGLKFRFKKSAPKTLNIDGYSRKITDIIKDEALMLELTSGNNNQIEQIY